MARADLLLKLVQAGSRGEQALFRKTVEALAAEERAKKHTILADRLLAQMQPNGFRVDRSASSLATRAGPLVTEVIPARELKDMVLPAEAEATVQELIEEQDRADLLRSYNLEPRHRVLLVGPPGNGENDARGSDCRCVARSTASCSLRRGHRQLSWGDSPTHRSGF